jgi:haloalkane dehalogenase
MIEANETFNGTWPFTPHFTEAPGFKMHYVDEGAGEPILCLHGEPTWGYLYRNFIPPLAKNYRVVVPDHMGFGKSETPQDKIYTLKTHVENLFTVLDELALEDITLVIQDWGGLIGGAAIATQPDRFKRVFVMNTAVYPFCDISPHFDALMDSDWFRFIRGEGNMEAVLGNLRYTALSVLKMVGFQNTAAATDDWVNAYSAPFGTLAECKGAIEFPTEVIDVRFPYLDPPSEELVAKLRAKPAMLAVGMQDRAIPPYITVDAFKQAFGERPIVELANAGHFCQEDEPQALVALIDHLMQLH